MEEFNERYFSDQPENLSFCFVNFFRKYVHFRDILRIHIKITEYLKDLSTIFCRYTFIMNGHVWSSYSPFILWLHAEKVRRILEDPSIRYPRGSCRRIYYWDLSVLRDPTAPVASTSAPREACDPECSAIAGREVCGTLLPAYPPQEGTQSFGFLATVLPWRILIRETPL